MLNLALHRNAAAAWKADTHSTLRVDQGQSVRAGQNPLRAGVAPGPQRLFPSGVGNDIRRNAPRSPTDGQRSHSLRHRRGSRRARGSISPVFDEWSRACLAAQGESARAEETVALKKFGPRINRRSIFAGTVNVFDVSRFHP